MRYKILGLYLPLLVFGTLVFCLKTNAEVLYTNGSGGSGCFRMDVPNGQVSDCENRLYLGQSDAFSSFSASYSIPAGRTATKLCILMPYPFQAFDTATSTQSSVFGYIGLDYGGDPSPARLSNFGQRIKNCETGLSFSGSGSISITRFSDVAGLYVNAIWTRGSDNFPTFTLEDNSNPLSIEIPQFASYNTNPSIVISGSCISSPNLVLHNQSEVASSTKAYYTQLSCGNGRYATSHLFNLPEDNGQWFIHASSTSPTSTAQTYFYMQTNNTSSTTEDFDFSASCNQHVGWSCDVYIIGDLCASAASIVDSVLNSTCEAASSAVNTFTETKPYKYIFQVKDFTHDLSMINASSTFPAGLFDATYASTLVSDLDDNQHPTTTVRIAVPFFGKSVELFNSRTSFESMNSIWLKIRPYEQAAIFIGFCWYLVYRFVL